MSLTGFLQGRVTDCRGYVGMDQKNFRTVYIFSEMYTEFIHDSSVAYFLRNEKSLDWFR